MSEMLRVLGLVPARGGSRGIPRKNIRSLGGRPLLAHTAAAALRATTLSEVVLSTEDEEIARIGREAGLRVPFLRPAELAGDDVATLPVVRHALEWLEGNGERFYAVCLLQPTSPFRRASTIDACVRLLGESGADSVVSVVPVPSEHNPHWVYFRSPEGFLSLATGESAPIPRRQELPPAYCRDGAVYVTRSNVVFAGSLYCAKVAAFVTEEDGEASVNLDHPRDWDRAERLVASREAAR